MSVVGYFKPGKAKAQNLLQAFCSVKGRVSPDVPGKLAPGSAAFYGVVPELMHLWTEAKREGRTWYYIDNAYFDQWREKYFRITKNRLQADGRWPGSPARLTKLGLTFKPWRKSGSHILLCPQSTQFMQNLAGWRNDWTDYVKDRLAQYTDREIRVKSWNRDKMLWYAEFPQAIKDCWCVVTWSSASAITAILNGVPAIVMADDCVARPMASHELKDIENPFMSDFREQWAMVAARYQFTRAEMESGYAWAVVNE